jgi:hypothetical protein
MFILYSAAPFQPFQIAMKLIILALQAESLPTFSRSAELTSPCEVVMLAYVTIRIGLNQFQHDFQGTIYLIFSAFYFYEMSRVCVIGVFLRITVSGLGNVVKLLLDKAPTSTHMVDPTATHCRRYRTVGM